MIKKKLSNNKYDTTLEKHGIFLREEVHVEDISDKLICIILYERVTLFPQHINNNIVRHIKLKLEQKYLNKEKIIRDQLGYITEIDIISTKLEDFNKNYVNYFVKLNAKFYKLE